MKFSNILWGLIFVLVGIIIGLNAFEVTNINIFFKGWWTLFLIIPGLIGLICEKEKISNLIIFTIGVLLLLIIQNIIDFSLFSKLFFPIIFVFLGLFLIFKGTSKIKRKKAIKETDIQEYVACFSSQKLTFQDKKISNSKLTSVFGSLKCDLENSDLNKETLIEVESIFGGVEIIVPKDVKVKITSTSIFGGVSNKHAKVLESKKTIYIEATCLFGGVEIK